MLLFVNQVLSMHQVIFQDYWIKPFISYCLLITLLFPLKPFATPPMDVPLMDVNDEDSSPAIPCKGPIFIYPKRNACPRGYATLATVAAILSIGVIYAVASTGHRRRCHSSRSSSRCYSSYPCYSNRSSSCSSDHRRTQRRRRHRLHDSYESSYRDNYSRDRGKGRRREEENRVDALGQPIPTTQMMVGPAGRAKMNAPQPHSKLEGTFFSCTHPSGQAKGNGTVFVQSPDGTTHFLGHLPLDGNMEMCVPCGPFHEPGTYVFGMQLDEGASICSQTRGASVEIKIDGSSVQRYDFIIPRHHPPGQPLSMFRFDFKNY
jgi:hypothetical protein